MAETAAAAEGVDELRRRNTDYDETLLELLDAAPAARIHDDFGDEWTIAMNLAHIAEFPGYFARQLDQWIDGHRVVVGRVAEYDADRNDALARAPGLDLDDLRDWAQASFAALRKVLDRVRDEHLTAVTHNVKYGPEPLTDYLARYVVSHKAAHVRQLRAALEMLES